MERRIYTDELEDLLKQKADQYKMYPSERVWKEVHKSLHPRKKWYWIGFALLLSGVGYYSVNELAAPVSTAPIAKSNTSKKENASQRAVPQDPVELVPFSRPVRRTEQMELNEQQTGALNSFSDEEFQDEELQFEESESILKPGKVVSITSYTREPDKAASKPVTTVSDDLKLEPVNGSDFIEKFLAKVDPLPSVTNEPEEQTPALTEASSSRQELSQAYNWLHEYAAYELSVPKTKRLSWQLFFSPTMNYRKLSGSRDAYLGSDVKNVPLALSIRGEIDGLVNHKPALGFEIGSALFYAVNKNLSLKVGMQFNYSRYGITAFNAPAEVATIALVDPTRPGYQRDSIQNYTKLRNFGGMSQQELQNQYFQISTPIGIEWRLLGNGKLQLNVSGSLQPTYLLNRNTYLITTDYKNYTKEPSLVRRWNVNSSAEAYISYKTGGVRWQLGPQFRYQLLSSYVDAYPVKEYLMEYGIKVGVTKTIR